MGQEKIVLGYVDCPACGTVGGMRVTHDKNGEPFGFCEANCNQQLRIGGSPRRVALFVGRYPWAAKPVPVTVTEKKPDAATEKKPVQVQEKKPAVEQAKPRAGFAFGL